MTPAALSRIPFTFKVRRNGTVNVMTTHPTFGVVPIIRGLPSVADARSFMLRYYNCVTFTDDLSGTFEEFAR